MFATADSFSSGFRSNSIGKSLDCLVTAAAPKIAQVTVIIAAFGFHDSEEEEEEEEDLFERFFCFSNCSWSAVDNNGARSFLFEAVFIFYQHAA